MAVTVALLTFCNSAAEVLPWNVVSPLYTAVMECDDPDTGSCAAVGVNVAHASGLGLQAEIAAGEPTLTLSILNCTVPVGTVDPDAGAMVAVNVGEAP